MMRVSIASIIVTVFAVAAVAILGSRYTIDRGWYENLRMPSWRPPDWAFPIAWTIIFTLTAISIVLIWNARPHTISTYASMALFIANGGLNILWSALFFGNRRILLSVYDAGLLCLSVIGIIAISIRISIPGALLLIPYAVWTAFATALTWTIYRLNP